MTSWFKKLPDGRWVFIRGVNSYADTSLAQTKKLAV
jgi:hypothetical protein